MLSKAKGSPKPKKNGISTMHVVLFMQATLMSVLVVAQVDFWLFDSALVNWLRNQDFSRLLVALLYVILFGGGGLLTLLAMRKPPAPDFSKMAEIPIPQIPWGAFGIKETEATNLQPIAVRYLNYMRAVNGLPVSGQYALHIGAIGQNGFLHTILSLAFMVPMLLICASALFFYSEAERGMTLAEVVAHSRIEWPFVFWPAFAILMVWSIQSVVFAMLRATRSIIKKAEQSIEIPNALYNPMERFHFFLQREFHVTSIIRSRLPKLIMSLGFFILLMGALMADWAVGLVGLTIIIPTILLQRIMATAGLTKCRFERDKVTIGQNSVHWKDCTYAQVSYAEPLSGGSPLRMLVMRNSMKVMHKARKVPAILTLHREGEEPLQMGLLHLEDANGKGLDCHEAEFFVAMLCAESGLVVKPLTDETINDDWVAFPRSGT